jgi:uncharacterized protein YkwD
MVLIAFVFAQGCMQMSGDPSTGQLQTAIIEAPAIVPAGGAPCATESPTAIAIQNDIAHVRSMAGLAPISCDSAAQSAASAHAAYVAVNASLTHTETPSLPSFVGATPPDRLAAFHFEYQVSGEVVGFDGTRECIFGVDGFINSVYHRAPFLRAESVVMGIGSQTGAVTIDFGRTSSHASDATQVVLWPPNSATHVPTTFAASYEVPNPVPEGASIVGSPVSLIAQSHLYDVSVTMVDGNGIAVVGKTLTGSNDSNVRASEAHFVPYAPLAAGTTFTVTFRVVMNDSHQKFTTKFTTN